MGGVSETIERHEGRLARTEEVLRAIVREARVEKLTFMAGSIAYHAFVSLLPALVLLYAVASPLGIDPESGIRGIASALLSQNVSDQIVTEITDSERSTGLSIVGLAVLIWGSLRIFRGLDTAFSDIYESEAANTFADQLTDGVIVLVTFAAAVFAAIYVGGRFPITGGGPVVAVVGALATVVGLTVAFLPMYYVFPDADVSVVEVLPGVVVASVGLALFASLFRLYVMETGKADSGSFVAAVILLLTWLYFSSLVILLGVAVNAVLSNRSRDVSIDPVVGGVERGERRSLAEREELVAELEELADRLDADPETFVARIDDEEVSLHPPQSITLDTDPDFGFGDDSVALELRWTPREE
ncbi:YihY/virulence factor BrkB family protein [Halomarina oriensis]|uniref:YihY/virulence factor BrkB family protein n=1 Tax=Halomarina oriensis TaxID=671145 RepID=A0A6B0GNG2_9EURY|nr:YihY/virulence factor BrkB family protein [Halomarina oriensis]MWG35127.1 YihY/virulence factor BrkB family protein [Halomarina oriensis]